MTSRIARIPNHSTASIAMHTDFSCGVLFMVLVIVPTASAVVFVMEIVLWSTLEMVLILTHI
jgi:hypothetical protein